MRKNSIKNTRINGEVQRELSEYHPRGDQGPADQSADISVVAVEVAPDLKDLQGIYQRSWR